MGGFYIYNASSGAYCACNMLSFFSPSNTRNGGLFSAANLPGSSPASLFSDPAVTSGTSVYASVTLWTDNALRFDQMEVSDSQKNRPWVRSGKGDVRTVSASCNSMPSQTCFLQQESALAGLGGSGCANATSLRMNSVSEINARVHAGYFE